VWLAHAAPAVLGFGLRASGFGFRVSGSGLWLADASPAVFFQCFLLFRILSPSVIPYIFIYIHTYTHTHTHTHTHTRTHIHIHIHIHIAYWCRASCPSELFLCFLSSFSAHSQLFQCLSSPSSPLSSRRGNNARTHEHGDPYTEAREGRWVMHHDMQRDSATSARLRVEMLALQVLRKSPKYSKRALREEKEP